MAGEKLIQKALGVLSKSAPQNVVTDATERAANLARFMENAKTPPVLYHASHADIPEFKRTKGSHLGFHFGDVEAANNRLEDTAEKFPWPKADRDERYAISEGHFNKLKAYEDALRRKNTEVPIDELSRALDAGEDIGPIFKKYEYAPTPEEQAQLGALREAYQSSQAPIIPPGGVGANVGAYHVAITNPLRLPDVGNWGSVREIKKNLPFDTDARSQADLLSELKGRGYDGIVYQNRVENPVMKTDSFIAFDPEQAKSAIGNAGTFDPTKPRVNEARGGEVDAALHAARQHFDEGGFLESLRGMFSGPDYQSTGEVASPTNWGDPESAADFFRADKALRLAQQAQASEDVTGSIPVREAPQPQRRPADLIASPPPAQAFTPVRVEDLAPARVTDARGNAPMSFASTAAPTPAPAQAAITAAIPVGAKFENRIDPNAIDERAENVWNRMLRQESGNRQFDRYGNTITSPAGALGISQVMPSTGPEAARLAGLPWSLERLKNDPAYNHALGRAYYDAQVERFGDPSLAAAAYNGGPGRVANALQQARATGRPWTDFLKPETQNYVRVVGRAEGGEIDGYAGGGDVIAKALAALRGGTKVFPKPQRMFPETARPPGGEYLNAATGEAMTGQKPAQAMIGVTPEGKPVFLASPEQVEATGSPGPGSTKTKTNLFKQQAGWKWNQAPEGYENVPTIVSAENRGQHYYALGADFPKGVDLERYANAASEPRLRPTTQGNVYPGEQVGSIDVRGREHPVYDMLTIRNMLAGTGAGVAGAAAMPSDDENYAHGGTVEDALHAVRRHFDGSDGSFVDSNRAMRDTIASIDPERSQDQPVMDPAAMGEAWNRARQNYQNFPVQEGEAVARQFVPSVRQEIGAAIAGEGGGRDYGSELRRRAAEFASGSSGLDTGIGALDFVPYAGQALGATDIAHDIGQGDYMGAAEGTALPVAMTAAQRYAGPIGRGLSYVGEKIAEHARPIAGAAGVAATMTPEDAEAANALKLIRAYHGSPYKFDRFDLSKIGRGEGAQAYGHGLYFAEHEPTAKYYRDTLAHKGAIDLEQAARERDLPLSREAQIDIRRMASGDKDPLDAAKWAQAANMELRPFDREKLANLIDTYRQSKTGHMYDVNIHTDPERLLNWDKPLREQSPDVRDILASHLASKSEEMANRSGFQNFKSNPQNFMDVGGHTFRPMNSAMSNDLESLGIPGIKYLDAGSLNTTGNPTHNYVIFNDKLIDINRRYAQGGDVEPASVEDRALMLVSKQA